MGLDATATAVPQKRTRTRKKKEAADEALAVVAVEEVDDSPRRKKKVKPAPPFKIGMAVTVKEKGKRQWSGTARTLKYSSESGWWFEVVNDEGLTWSCHQSTVKEAKSRAKKDAVPLRRRRQGRAGTSVATAVG